MSRLRNKLKSSIEASKLIPDNFEINEYSTYIKQLVNDKLNCNADNNNNNNISKINLQIKNNI